jgi:zinc protease
MAIPTEGTAATVAAISLTDVQEFYENYFAPNVTNMVVVGDLDKDAILGKLAFLKSWARKDVQYPTLPATPEAGKTKIYLVDKPDAAQSEIRMGYLALPYDATGEYYRSRLMVFNLGGNFNSRLTQKLREEKGWTYGSYAYFNGSEEVGPFVAGGGFKREATDSAVVEFMNQFKNFREGGVTEEELTFLKSAKGQEDALKYEAGYQKTGFLNSILRFNLEKDFTEKQNDILKNLTKEEVDALAKKYIDPEKMAIVVVGDKAAIYEGLSKLPYEIEVVNLQLNMDKK